uniref:hypothetical protein n=1 Tax=Agathobacter sp. TaxID=2021311 RepID=UPI004057C0DD
MKRKLLTFVLAMVLFLSTNSIKIEAMEANQIEDCTSELKNCEQETLEIQTAELPGIAYNIQEHEAVNKSFFVQQVQAASSENEADNTDPNNAIEILNADTKTGNLTVDVLRWYYFEVETLSKITLYMSMDETIDADLYLYSLNTETGELINIASSLTEGLGNNEALLGTIEAGIYFIGVYGYEGSGDFALEYYISTKDLANEFNDSPATATDVSGKSNVTGIIDSPYDLDFYKITLSEASAVRFELKYTSKNYEIIYYSGNGLYAIKENLYALDTGTHYFAVYSPDSSYSDNSTYTLHLEDIAPISTDSTATRYAVCDDANIVFQFNSQRTKYYVNGNEIDFSYSYNKNLSNSAGSQSYDISLTRTADFNVCLLQEEGTSFPLEYQQRIPDVARYVSSSLTGVSGKYVLTLSVIDINNPCYKIHVRGTGNYSGISYWKDLNFANVFIDPDTGKIIDIEWYNYFYENGNHSVSYTRPYTMKYYYPYWNGSEPEGGDD